MRNLCSTKQIHGMRISRNGSRGILKFSHNKDIKKMLNKFNVGHAKTKHTLLGTHLKFFKRRYSQTNEEVTCLTYTSAISSLMYVMVCTRLYIAHALRVVS